MSAGGRPIAVKVIRTELATDPEFRARFRREVAAARKVSGLFTALVIDADLDSPTPWLATAYVAGPSLTEAVRDHGPLPVSTVLALAAGLAESLTAIHAAGVVHGDLKPSNVLLAEDGPRLIDFGISQAAEASPAHGPRADDRLARLHVTRAGPGLRDHPGERHVQPGRGADLRRLGPGTVRLRVERRDDIPAGQQPGQPGEGTPRRFAGLIGNCLAKHPSDRPTPRELLDQVGAIQPSPAWLAESILSSFTRDRSAAGSSDGGQMAAWWRPRSWRSSP